MSTPSNNWSATSYPVGVASGRNLFPRVTTGSIKSSLRGSYFFKAYGTTNGTTNFSAGSSSETVVVLSAVDELESSGVYNASTGVFTVPVKGLYSFEVCTGDSSRLQLKVTSGSSVYYPVSGGHGFSTEIALEEGDQVCLTVYDDTSLTVSTYSAPFGKSYLTMANAPYTTFGGRLVMVL